MRHVDRERVLSKRSVDYDVGDEDYQQDEVFSASEVIGNIFNENDTLSGLNRFGKDDGEFRSEFFLCLLDLKKTSNNFDKHSIQTY